MTTERDDLEALREQAARAIFAACYHPDDDEELINQKWLDFRQERELAFKQADAALRILLPWAFGEVEKVAVEFEHEENGRAYDKRQAGRDDNFNCARASAAARITLAIRARLKQIMGGLEQ